MFENERERFGTLMDYDQLPYDLQPFSRDHIAQG